MFHHNSNQAVSSCGISKTDFDDSSKSQSAAGTSCLEQENNALGWSEQCPVLGLLEWVPFHGTRQMAGDCPHTLPRRGLIAQQECWEEGRWWLTAQERHQLRTATLAPAR